MNIAFIKKIDAFCGTFLVRILGSVKHEAREAKTLPRSFLIIRPGGIGDAVHLVPALRRLRSAFPSSRIDILAEKRNAGAFSMCSDIDRVFLYDRPGELLRVLRLSYDVVIDTEQWHRLSAVVARLVRSSRKIGFGTNERRRMLTHAIPYSHEDYEMESFFRLLAPLEIAPEAISQGAFLNVPNDARKRVYKVLARVGQPYVALFPGASIVERQWGSAKFTALANLLRGAGFSVVVVGGADVRGQGDEIVEEGGLNLAGSTSLAETAAVLESSALLVSGDSGVLHLAVGLDVPTVSLFGPGIVAKWAPRGSKHRVLNLGLSCSPCTRFGTTPPCPIQARCLSEISVEDVFVQVRGLLENRPQVGDG